MSFDLSKMIPELEDRIGDFIDDLVSGLTSETDLDEWDLRDQLNENHLSTAILNAFTPMLTVAIEDVIEEKSEETESEGEYDYGIKNFDYDTQPKDEYSSLREEDIDPQCKAAPNGLNPNGEACET